MSKSETTAYMAQLWNKIKKIIFNLKYYKLQNDYTYLT